MNGLGGRVLVAKVVAFTVVILWPDLQCCRMQDCKCHWQGSDQGIGDDGNGAHSVDGALLS